MKMRTLRHLKKQTVAPRKLRAPIDVDVSEEPDPGPAPECVFDRSTGPFDRRRSFAMPGAADEET
jgi:hypothetical protein